MSGLITCPGCGDMIEPGYKWCPECGKWLRHIGPTASELHYRRKDLLYAARMREDATPRKGKAI